MGYLTKLGKCMYPKTYCYMAVPGSLPPCEIALPVGEP